MVRFQEQELNIGEITKSLSQGLLASEYVLYFKEGIAVSQSHNPFLGGVSINGTVTGIHRNRIQADLEADAKSRYSFPFSTVAASPDGSGWYCMPEIGDDVRVYFPSKQEGEAIALSSVSNYNAPQDGGEDRMKDPDSRYLRTKAGQELALAPEYIRLSCREDTAAVTIKNDGKVTIQSQVKVEAQAEEELTLHAEEELKIHVLKAFSMQSLDGGLIESGEGKVLLMGTEVNFD